MRALMKIPSITKIVALFIFVSSISLNSQVEPVLQENKVRADNAAASQVK